MLRAYSNSSSGLSPMQVCVGRGGAVLQQGEPHAGVCGDGGGGRGQYQSPCTTPHPFPMYFSLLVLQSPCTSVSLYFSPLVHQSPCTPPQAPSPPVLQSPCTPSHPVPMYFSLLVLQSPCTSVSLYSSPLTQPPPVLHPLSPIALNLISTHRHVVHGHEHHTCVPPPGLRFRMNGW